MAADPLALVLAATHRAGFGLYLGETSGRPAFARPEHGLLVLGPPRAGKTTTVAVPNVVAACGAVVAASTKVDLMATTAPARVRVGECWLFDPSGTVRCPRGVKRVAWTPLGPAKTWDGAVLVAESMVLAARPGTERGEAAHWSERAAGLLACMFHAGALEERPIASVVAEVDRHRHEEALAALARHGAERAIDLLQGIAVTDGREQSGIFSTASGVLAGYRTDAALGSGTGDRIDATGLVSSTDTVYICAPTDHQRHVAPLVAGLLREVRSAAYARAAVDYEVSSNERDRPAPTVFVLDELANIAPLHDLPSLVAEGGSQGVLTLACLQNLAQARSRWGADADGFLSLFGAKLIFPGIGDTRTLEAISVLAGDHQVPALSVTRTSGRAVLGRRAGPTSRTLATRTERRLPVAEIARGHDGYVLGMDGTRPGFVRSTPWHDHPSWRAAVLGLDAARGNTSLGRAAAPKIALLRAIRERTAAPGRGSGRGLGR